MYFFFFILATNHLFVVSLIDDYKTKKRYIYVPDKVVENPPLVVVIHSCQSTAQSYFRNSKIPWAQGSDKKGYITVWPSSPHSGTCWDVSSRQSLKHDGGGDPQAISNMIRYAISNYKVDRKRVFVTGGSSGGESFLFGMNMVSSEERGSM